MKVNFNSCLLIPALLILSCTNKNKDQQAKDKAPVIVDIMIAENSGYDNKVEVNGSVLSEETVDLHPEISGRIIYLNLPDGEKVNEGTVLVRINDADLEAQLEQQKVLLDIADKTEKRLKKLLEINGVNQSDYDAALAQVDNIKATIKVIEAQIDKTVIRAPFTGELGLRLVSNGAYVTPQTLLGTIQQKDRIKIDFTVPESYLSLVKKGNTVDIQTGDDSKFVKATISAIEPQINTNTRNFKVRARLAEGALSPGSFVKVILREQKQGILVPSNAIIPDAQSNQIVVVKGNKAVFKNVGTGTRTSDMTEISEGLKQGDSVVVSGVLFVRPNSKVKVRKSKIFKKKD